MGGGRIRGSQEKFHRKGGQSEWLTGGGSNLACHPVRAVLSKAQGR